MNKTPLSAATNRAIGGLAPSQYLSRVEKKAGITPEQLDALVNTHLVNGTHLRADNFEEFFRSRLDELIVLVERATGRSVPLDLGDDSTETPENFDPEDAAVKADLDDQETPDGDE